MLFTLPLPTSLAVAETAELASLDAGTVMANVARQAQPYPFVYEELSMILVDRDGNRDVRNTRRYTRIDASGATSVLLVFDSPEEVRGVALRALLDPAGNKQVVIYLPTLPGRLLSTAGQGRASHFLGTDFAIDDLQPERINNYHYQRLADLLVDEQPYYVIEAMPVSAEVSTRTGYYRRLLTVNPDNWQVVQTRYFDRHDKLVRQQTHHGLKEYAPGLWRAAMLLMENLPLQHQTLIKTRRRVFSADYVPLSMFTDDWLFNNQHMASTVQHLFGATQVPAP